MKTVIVPITEQQNYYLEEILTQYENKRITKAEAQEKASRVCPEHPALYAFGLELFAIDNGFTKNKG